MADTKRYLEFLEGEKDRMIEEAQYFSSFESGSRYKEGIDRVGPVAAKAFEDLGFTTEIIEETEVGNHMRARRKGKGKGKLLGVIHLDTMQPQGTINEHPLDYKDGKVYGPGIADMKGGWVVLLSAIRALDNAGWDGLEEITIIAPGDEELGSPHGRKYVEEEARRADWQVVMEGSREMGQLAVARGVVGAIYFTIRGQRGSAHSREGANALHEAIKKVPMLEDLSDFDRGMIISVGILESGTARQVTPHEAWLSIDLRADKQEDAEELVRRVREIADKNLTPGVTTEMTGGITRPEFKRNEGNVKMLEIAKEVGNEIGVEVTEAEKSRGGSDGNFGAAMGVATLDGLGTLGGREGNGRHYIIADALPVKGALLAGLISRLPETL